MSTGRIFYWLLVGALFGLGVIAILSIGVFLLAAGLALLIFGAIRFGARGLWAGLVGFGAAPALLLLWDVTSQPWACNPGGPGLSDATTQTGVNYYTCVNTPVGVLTAYHVMAAGFGAIALVGLLLGLAALLWRRGRHARGPLLA